MKMAVYKCFKCGKKIQSNKLDARFICPFCNSKIFYKPRTHSRKLKAI
ncbi:DNA-directed RNA polymerase subunit P [Candidatus Pacearchaeota archaeon CG10_big_fil_rev_8_21_14_0_10_32_14]|nr:MAG: DNA-directed RNA polymerase subunit P [Candidatus Pacearchaeota archaeon CG10_big_fil_rev_8_21_14_0_10_32_14]